MSEATCEECGQEVEAEDADGLESKLRAHYLGKNDGEHEYDREDFQKTYSFGEEDQEETKEEVEDVPEDDEENEEDLMEVNQMEETSLDDLVEETAEESDEEIDEEVRSDRKGLDTAINNAWGRLLTADLDPEEEETTNLRKNLQGLAEDVGLGQNAKHYYEEELSGQTDDPKKDLMGSLILATALSLSIRPDAIQKLKDVRGGDQEDA